MAGAPTALGTIQGKAVSSLTIPGVTLRKGESLFVDVAFDNTTDSLSDVTLNGVSLGVPPANSDGSTFMCFGFEIHNAAADVTGDIVATFSGVVIWATMSAESLRGAKVTPADVTDSAGGTSTTPATVGTGTLAQASEYVRGIIVTNGPSGDAAGSWTNSLTGAQRVGTTGGVATSNGTLATGQKVVAATTAVVIGKTGITSREWLASCATYKLVDDQAATLGRAAGTGAARAVTKAAGAAGITLGVAAAVGACLPVTPSNPVEITYNPPDVSSSFEPDPDPWHPSSPYTIPQTIYTRSSTAVVTSRNATYLAYVQNHDQGYCTSDGPYVIDGIALRNTAKKIAYPMLIQSGAIIPFLFMERMTMTLAIDSLPVARQSSEEVNYLLAYHEIGGRILYGIGITPSGRIVYTTAGLPDLVTPINTLPADRAFHTIECSGGSFAELITRSIFVDAHSIVKRVDECSDGAGNVYMQSIPAPYVGTLSRIMFLNGPDGLTLLDARINRFSPCRGLEYILPKTPFATLAPTTNTTGLNCDLDAQFVTPLPITPYGPVPNVDPASLLQTWSKTPFIMRNPIAPIYTPVPR